MEQAFGIRLFSVKPSSGYLVSRYVLQQIGGELEIIMAITEQIADKVEQLEEIAYTANLLSLNVSI